MEAGLVYDPADQEIMDDQAQRLELMYDFNASRPSEYEKRMELLRKMLGKWEKDATSSRLSEPTERESTCISAITSM